MARNTEIREKRLISLRVFVTYGRLVPVAEVFHVYEPIKCEKCRKIIAETTLVQKP